MAIVFVICIQKAFLHRIGEMKMRVNVRESLLLVLDALGTQVSFRDCFPVWLFTRMLVVAY